MLLVEQQKEIAPGNFAQLEVEIPTHGVEGRVLKSFLVTTDASESYLHTIELRLGAKIEALVQAIPSQIHFGIIKGSGMHKRTVRLRSSFTDLATKFHRVACDNPFLSVKLTDQKPGLLTFTVELDQQIPSGDFGANLNFFFDIPEFPETSIVVLGRNGNIADLTVVPPRVDLTSWHGQDSKAVKLRVESRSQTAFKLLSVEAPQAIIVSWKQSRLYPAVYDLEVTRKGEFSHTHQENHVQFITLFTDRKEQPVLKVPIIYRSSLP